MPEVEVLSDGMYRMSSMNLSMYEKSKKNHYIIDAKSAIDSMRAINCDNAQDKRFDCDAAQNFSTSIFFTKEQH